jgi:ribonuclease R
MVSGLVRADELGAEAELDDTHQRWFLRRTGKSFRIGEKLKVVVASVNLARRQIDLRLAEPVPGGPKKAVRPDGPQRRPQSQKGKPPRGGQRRRR